MKKSLLHLLGILCWALLLHVLPLKASVDDPVDVDATDLTIETLPEQAPDPVRTPIIHDDYAFSGITVDITATSPNEARLKAMEEAQHLAFQKLIASHAPEKGQVKLKNFTAPQIEKLVQDIEVEKEKYSTVRYVATFKVTFKTQAVKDLFANDDTTDLDDEESLDDSPHDKDSPRKAPAIGSALPGRPSIVVPVFLLENKKLLWEESNPWLQAFAHDPTPSPLLVVPTGDLTDISDMGLTQALNPSAENLDKFAVRHEAPQVIIAIVQEKEKGQPTLDMVLYGNGKRLSQQTKPLLPSGNLEATLKSATQMVSDFVKNPPFAQDSVDQEEDDIAIVSHTDSHQPSINAEVSFSSLKEWLFLKKNLELVPGVRSVMVKKLARRSALVHIQTSLSAQDVTKALNQKGVSVSNAPNTTLLKIQALNIQPSLANPNTSNVPPAGELHELS